MEIRAQKNKRCTTLNHIFLPVFLGVSLIFLLERERESNTRTNKEKYVFFLKVQSLCNLKFQVVQGFFLFQVQAGMVPASYALQKKYFQIH